MAFILRRPFAITVTLRQLPQTAKTSVRHFHQPPLKQNVLASKPQSPSPFSTSRNVFQATFKRHYTPPGAGAIPTANGSLGQRFMWSAALFGGTAFAINMVFNRETRDDGGMPPYEREYLNDTFLHTGLGLGVIAVAARALHMNGWSYRLMAANPWLVMGVGLAASIGTMIATRSTDPDK
jgi:growth hormone-inducible transmembrane protein